MSKISSSSSSSMNPQIQQAQSQGPKILLELDGVLYVVPKRALDTFQVKMPAERNELKLVLQQSKMGRAPANVQLNKTATVVTFKT